MKKADIAEKLAAERNISKKEATEIIDSVIDIIKTGIKEDGKVDIFGFAKFTKVFKDARTARVPKTGETVNVPAKNIPRAKFSSLFKKEIADIVE